ncbi:MAG: lipopolysaccharide biosynthesis protein [Cyclobacteriaceae bacterium]
MGNLDKKIASGVGWVSLSALGNQGFRLAVKLILARILLPEHYGLIGMAVVFTSFVKVISELGMGAALIQRSKRKLTEEYFHTAFWTNLTVSFIGFAIISIGLAPVAAWFYEEPILQQLVPVLAIPIILDSLYLIPKVQLTRELDFKPQAIIELTSVIIAGIISIVLATMGYGVWSLAFNGIIASGLSALLYFAWHKWYPRLVFSWEACRNLFGFGGYVLIEQIFVFFTSNIDYILIGKLIGSAALGIYTLAFILTDTFRKQIMGILNKVLFPAYSSIQHNAQAVRQYYLNVIRVNGIILFPVMTAFMVLAEPIILLGFGEEWRETIFPLRMLSIGVIIHAISGTSSTVMKSMGKAKLVTKLNILITVCVSVPAIAIGAYTYGINGVAVGVVVFKLIGYFIYQRYIHQVIKVPMVTAVSQFTLITVFCLGSGILVFVLQKFLQLPMIGFSIMGGVLLLTAYSIYLLRFEKELVSQIRKVIRPKKIAYEVNS